MNILKKYNEIIKSVCGGNDVYFVEVFDSFLKTEYKNLLFDGVHPNSEGYQKMFDIVRDSLIENKII